MDFSRIRIGESAASAEDDEFDVDEISDDVVGDDGFIENDFDEDDLTDEELSDSYGANVGSGRGRSSRDSGLGSPSFGTFAFQRLRESVVGSDEVDEGIVESAVDDLSDTVGDVQGDVATEIEVAGSTTVDGVSDKFFHEFLSDDDEVSTPVVASPVSTPAPVEATLIEYDEALTERDVRVKEEKWSRKLERGSLNRAREEERRIKNHSRSTDYRSSRRGLDSTWAKRGALEHVVDDSGIPDTVIRKQGSSEAFDKLLDVAERHGDVKMPEGGAALAADATARLLSNESQRGNVVFPWSTSREVDREESRSSGTPKRFKTAHGQQRLNQQELGFFRSLHGKKSDLIEDEELWENIRPPKGKESESAKKRRLAVVNAAAGGAKGYTKKVRSSVTPLDQEYLRFLARFRYATARHMGRLNGVSEVSALKRLKGLKSKGLVDSMPLWGAAPLWVVTAAGMLLSGYDLPLITEKTFSAMYVPHQFTVNNTAGNLWGGKINVLQLDDFPSPNRTNWKGERVLGEELVSETELQSSLSSMRLGNTAEVFRPQITGAIEDAFRLWSDAGVKSGFQSPEFMAGNEYMWCLYPPFGEGKSYHVPDLVVPRERNVDGSPESIAVEIELGSKKTYDYDATLRAYRSDHRIFKKVIWVCKDTYPARVLEETAVKLGLWQEGRIDIVPVLTEQGMFTGRDLWKI